MGTEPQKRVAGLDHLRATAIILVLLFHYRVYYGIPETLDVLPIRILSSFGWTGVDLFFVLSGYLIGKKLFEDARAFNTVRFGDFYLNRSLRILPAYFATVAIYFLVVDFQEGRALQPLWRFLTFTVNLHADLYANTFSHAWSLAVEEHFYLLFPLLLWCVLFRSLGRHGVALLLVLFAAGFLIRYVNLIEFVDDLDGRKRLGAGMRFLYYPSYTRLDGLIVGIATAALVTFRPDVWQKILRWDIQVFALGIAGLGFSYWFFGGNILSGKFTSLPVALFGFPILSVSYGMLLVVMLNPERAISRNRISFSYWMATLAFSIYLVHKMGNHWLNKNLPELIGASPEFVFTASLAVAVIAGAVLYFVIEKPFLQLRKRLESKRQLDPDKQDRLSDYAR